MACCASAIDDKLNAEIPYSGRSLSMATNSGNSYFNFSARSCDMSKATFRHSTSEEYIEKNNTLNNLSTNGSRNSEINSDTHSGIVPPLDLKSEENFCTTDYTFSYRKHCEADKVILHPDNAYKTWLSAKRKLLSDEAARRKEKEEMKQAEIKERKRLAKEKFEMWLKKKSEHSIGVQQPNAKECCKTENNLETRARCKYTPEQIRARLEEWEREKRLKEERRYMLKCQEEERRRQLQEQRRQMAVKAWDNWIANASKKPKPVPLNRGIFTLRGTVSDIFINPNEWKPVIPINDEEN